MAQAAEQQLRRDRANRDAARAELDGQIARIHGDLEQRGIGGRIADEAAAKALAAMFGTDDETEGPNDHEF